MPEGRLNEKIGESYHLLDQCARAQGHKAVCPGHDIFTSDPWRVVPEKLKTIVRLPAQG